MYVHNSFFDAHRNNMVLTTKGGGVFIDAPIPTYPRGAIGLDPMAAVGPTGSGPKPTGIR